jgi:hypothetical protein
VEKSQPTNTFVLTRLIGGKLRALYNEEAQPCSSRMGELLETLASANRKVLAETSPLEDERTRRHLDRDNSFQEKLIEATICLQNSTET